MGGIDRDQLVGTWIHSHEEDSGAERVYRREGFDFPPSRGRDGFRLEADGSAETIGPGPADVPGSAPASWRLTDDELTISGLAGLERLRITELAAGRIVAAVSDR